MLDETESFSAFETAVKSSADLAQILVDSDVSGYPCEANVIRRARFPVV